ncbi:MAG: 2-hydroxyacyl-CoA dehydratase family protein [Spirochaetes bacterium]|jgi:hypothetical protein|nr:2-hydroxyacyl-CoA dehydratase family protein [Spirochaetota bacterium]
MNRQKPGIADAFILLKHKIINWAVILGMVFRRGVYYMLLDLKRYPWMMDLLKVNRLLNKFAAGRTGNYRKAVSLVVTQVTKDMVELLEGIFHHRDRLVIHEDMVPPEILRAMGLKPWMPEILGILLPMMDPSVMEKYIDAAENEGIPPDLCSLPKATMGLAVKGYIPVGQAIVTSNLPCDGGMNSYALIEKKLKLPTFRLDIPYNFYNDEAEVYFAGELRRMISWLEKHTLGKMDWNLLREICIERNRMAEIELELWDMIRQKPAPVSAEAVYISHLWGFNVFPGYKSSTELFRKIASLAKGNLDKGIAAVQDEKYRALLWNPPTMHFIDLFAWAEQAYGVSLIMDSMSYNRLPFIDTENEETMLRGLGRNIMQGPMARHTRGPMENFFDDMFHIVKAFDIDMIFLAGHIGCKNTQALNGILREKARELGLPVLIIDYDLSDTRIVPRTGIMAQVDHFMENVMNTKKRI